MTVLTIGTQTPPGLSKRFTDQSGFHPAARPVLRQKDCCFVEDTHHHIRQQDQSEQVLVDQSHLAMVRNLWLVAKRKDWYQFALHEADLYLDQLS